MVDCFAGLDGIGDLRRQPLRSLLRQKLVDAVKRPLPQLTRRDTWIPRLPGKTLAVIGISRSGKTSLLWQQVGERLAAGAELAWLQWCSRSACANACAMPAWSPRSQAAMGAAPSAPS